MLKYLRVNRPLIFFDVETTGLDPHRDRIVEIALVRINPGARPQSHELRFNPEQPIPPRATAIHGITDEQVAHCPTFSQKAAELADLVADTDLAGFGIARFDLPFLAAEFERAGWEFSLHDRKVVDVLRLYHRLEPRDLAAAVRRYCGGDHVRAHHAGDDAMAAVAVFDAMLGEHHDLPHTVSELHDLLVPVDVEGWFRREGNSIYFARGKHRDVSLNDVARLDASYLDWLAGRVMPDTHRLIETALFGNAD